MFQKSFPFLEIDFRAISHNLNQIRKLIGPSVKIAPVVKANAYGAGIIPVSQFLESQKIDYLCVSRIDEALKLRENQIKTPILILSYTSPIFFKEIVANNLTVTISSLELAKSLATEARRREKIIKVHVKVETGMHRIGIETPQILFFLKKIFDLPNLEVEGLFTHFSDADNPDLEFTRLQLRRFQEMLSELELAKIKIPLIHASNSAATLRLKEAHFDMVRPGISLYGYKSSLNVNYDFDFHPVFTLKTKIIQINRVPENEFIGYGKTYQTPKDKLVGTIAIGYGDGFRRSPQNFDKVLVKGIFCPILGRIAMDACDIDLDQVVNPQVGDEVVLIGKSEDEIISVDDVAEKWGTINYEVITSIKERVTRVYRKN